MSQGLAKLTQNSSRRFFVLALSSLTRVSMAPWKCLGKKEKGEKKGEDCLNNGGWGSL